MPPNDLTQFYDAIIYNLCWQTFTRYLSFIKYVIACVHAHVPSVYKQYVPRAAEFPHFICMTHTQHVFEKWKVFAHSGTYMLQPRGR